MFRPCEVAAALTPGMQSWQDATQPYGPMCCESEKVCALSSNPTLCDAVGSWPGDLFTQVAATAWPFYERYCGSQYELMHYRQNKLLGSGEPLDG